MQLPLQSFGKNTFLSVVLSINVNATMCETPNVPNQNFPFDPTDKERRSTYITDRLSGKVVAPVPTYSEGEDPVDLIVSWAEREDIEWSDRIYGDIRENIRNYVSNVVVPGNDKEILRNIYGGLIEFGIRTSDQDSANIVVEELLSLTEECRIDYVRSLSVLKSMYGYIGQLIYRLIHVTDIERSETMLREFIETSPRLLDRVKILTYLAMRDPDSAEENYAQSVFLDSIREQNREALFLTLDLLLNVCWDDNWKTAKEKLKLWTISNGQDTPLSEPADIPNREFLAGCLEEGILGREIGREIGMLSQELRYGHPSTHKAEVVGPEASSWRI